jgi:thiol:disulfide interchange protein
VTALLDARGCLTPAGVAALERGAVGEAPAELARHVATCDRCQARLLAAATGRAAGVPARPQGVGAQGRLWRPVVFIVAALLLALFAVAMLGLLPRG